MLPVPLNVIEIPYDMIRSLVNLCQHTQEVPDEPHGPGGRRVAVSNIASERNLKVTCVSAPCVSCMLVLHSIFTPFLGPKSRGNVQASRGKLGFRARLKTTLGRMTEVLISGQRVSTASLDECPLVHTNIRVLTP